MLQFRKLGVGFVLTFVLALSLAPAQAAPFKKGQKFPAFTLKTVDGTTISPAALKNKAYWLTFFSSTWGTCNAEAPHLQKVQNAVKNKGGMVLGIALQGDTVATLKEFQKDTKTSYPIAIDSPNKFGKFVESIPYTVLVDRNGLVSEVHEGFDEDYTANLKTRYLKMLSGR